MLSKYSVFLEFILARIGLSNHIALITSFAIGFKKWKLSHHTGFQDVYLFLIHCMADLHVSMQGTC